MVPGSFGFGSVVFAAITTLAPSAAARLPMARPMPREAPVMKRVLPCSVMDGPSWKGERKRVAASGAARSEPRLVLLSELLRGGHQALEQQLDEGLVETHLQLV